VPIPSLRDLLWPAASRFVKYENVSVPIGVNDAYGSPVVFKPFGAAFTWFKVGYAVGGAIAVLEVVTVMVETVLDDGSTLRKEKSTTAARSEWLSDDDMLGLVKHGRNVIAVRVYAKTNMPSTGAAVTATLVGHG
jgi:hypothetical protein